MVPSPQAATGYHATSSARRVLGTSHSRPKVSHRLKITSGTVPRYFGVLWPPRVPCNWTHDSRSCPVPLNLRLPLDVVRHLAIRNGDFVTLAPELVESHEIVRRVEQSSWRNSWRKGKTRLLFKAAAENYFGRRGGFVGGNLQTAKRVDVGASKHRNGGSVYEVNWRGAFGTRIRASVAVAVGVFGRPSVIRDNAAFGVRQRRLAGSLLSAKRDVCQKRRTSSFLGAGPRF